MFTAHNLLYSIGLQPGDRVVSAVYFEGTIIVVTQNGQVIGLRPDTFGFKP